MKCDPDIIESLNILAAFCSAADLQHLDRNELKQKTGLEQADVMVLFGGSILAGAEVLAKAMDENLARTYIIAGGHGHTTETLRQFMKEDCSRIDETLKSEAELFDQYLQLRFGKKADWLETESTNCGNNITFVLDLLREKSIPCTSMILVQDASMQRRMLAGLQKQAPYIRAVSCPAYQIQFSEKDGQLGYDRAVHGMWKPERFLELLMGEIPRLHDTKEGYGPEGKNFIVHVDLPDAVLQAFEFLQKEFPASVRNANPAFAAPESSNLQNKKQ